MHLSVVLLHGAAFNRNVRSARGEHHLLPLSMASRLYYLFVNGAVFTLSAALIVCERRRFHFVNGATFTLSAPLIVRRFHFELCCFHLECLPPSLPYTQTSNSARANVVGGPVTICSYTSSRFCSPFTKVKYIVTQSHAARSRLSWFCMINYGGNVSLLLFCTVNCNWWIDFFQSCFRKQEDSHLYAPGICKPFDIMSSLAGALTELCSGFFAHWSVRWVLTGISVSALQAF